MPSEKEGRRWPYSQRNALRDLSFELGAPKETKATRAETRAAIDAALTADLSRSDREIAKAVGCDHKTVAARRGEIENPQVGKLDGANSRPTSQVGKFDDGNSSREESNSSPLPVEAQAASEKSTSAKRDDWQFDWKDKEAVVFQQQSATAIYFNLDGDLVIRQRNWPDDDSYVVITPQCQREFLDRLCDAVGVSSFGGKTDSTR